VSESFKWTIFGTPRASSSLSTPALSNDKIRIQVKYMLTIFVSARYNTIAQPWIALGWLDICGSGETSASALGGSDIRMLLAWTTTGSMIPCHISNRSEVYRVRILILSA